jgi:hypothetical protein
MTTMGMTDMATPPITATPPIPSPITPSRRTVMTTMATTLTLQKPTRLKPMPTTTTGMTHMAMGPTITTRNPPTPEALAGHP